MPVDPAAGNAPPRTGDGPYGCSDWPRPPGAGNAWADQAGYCRTSLDLRGAEARCGSSDPRCPAACPHNAPPAVTELYNETYQTQGALAAAALSKQFWENSMSDAIPANAGFYTKKPITVHAARWFKNGDHPSDYANVTQGLEGGELRSFSGAEGRARGWEGGVVRRFRHPDVPGAKPCERCGKPHHVHGWIDTLEQGHRVCPGDWIITGVAGERYPCKPAIFDATYAAGGAFAAAGGAPPQNPALVAALKQHGLKHDAPSQLADAFRAGWNAGAAGAHRAACSLAQGLFDKHFRHHPDYASGRVVWGLCDSAEGVISQIDNMTCGLVEPGAPPARRRR